MIHKKTKICSVVSRKNDHSLCSEKSWKFSLHKSILFSQQPATKQAGLKQAAIMTQPCVCASKRIQELDEESFVEGSPDKCAYHELLGFLHPNEEVEAVVFGPWGWEGRPRLGSKKDIPWGYRRLSYSKYKESTEDQDEQQKPHNFIPYELRGRLLSWAEAAAWMTNWQFLGGYGSPDTYAVRVWTKEIMSTKDGSLCKKRKHPEANQEEEETRALAGTTSQDKRPEDGKQRRRTDGGWEIVGGDEEQRLTNVHHLPRELLLHIFSLCDTPSLKKAMMTCTEWYDCGKAESLWKARSPYRPANDLTICRGSSGHPIWWVHGAFVVSKRPSRLVPAWHAWGLRTLSDSAGETTSCCIPGFFFFFLM